MPKSKPNRLLKEKLLHLLKEDQKIIGEKKETTEAKRLEVTQELERVIDKYGWPTIFLVGREGTEAAWIIAQHADFNIPFQKKCLVLIKKASLKNGVPRHHIAYLTDRILINTKKPQIFGTQFARDKRGKFQARPIKNKKLLNKRRQQYNLPPFKEYKILLNKARRST